MRYGDGVYDDGVGAVVQLVEYRTRNQEVAGSTHIRSTVIATLSKLLTYCVCSCQLSLLPSAGREMSSSYGYRVKA